MLLVLSLVLIVLLYTRTFRYCNLIDDKVPMKDTLYSVPTEAPSPDFYRSPSRVTARIWAVTVHMLNTVLVYLLAGEKAALLFAVCPICVNNVAWITGSYYSTATFLTLGGYYVLLHSPWWVGVPFSMMAFGAALNATLVTISFPFIAVWGTPLAAALIVPLYFFLRGKRFTEGKKIREGHLVAPGMLDDRFTPKRLVFCSKILAHYLYTALFPIKLCFFHFIGFKFMSKPDARKNWQAMNKLFWSGILLITSFLVFSFVTGNLFWGLWFLILMAAFCQFKILGQFFAERYMYPAMVGFCAVLAAIPGEAYWMLVGAYILRTYFFIPVFENNRKLYENGVIMEPKEGSNFVNLSDWHLMVEPDLSLAGYYAQEAMKRDPEDFKPHLNMSSLFMYLKQWEFALRESKSALTIAEGRAGDRVLNIIKGQCERIENIIAGLNEKK